MINIDTIEQEWEQDSTINPVELDKAALEIPGLHNKYLKYYNKCRLLILQLEDKLVEEVKLKTLYYSGKLSKEELEDAGLEPFGIKVLRADIKTYLEADDKIKRLKSKIEYSKVVLEYLKSIVDSINRRNFSIKSAIDWRKFTAGEA